jgi:hypothetical protein
MPRYATRFLLVCAALSGAVVTAPSVALANVCQEGPELLNQRRALIEKLNNLNKGGKNKQVHPSVACKALSELVTNGSAAMKWIESNGDWCQAPPNLKEGMKADHERATKIRTQACDAAKKVAEMERRAKQQQQSGGSGLLGGDGLTGTMRVPRGAL